MIRHIMCRERISSWQSLEGPETLKLLGSATRV
jgi:hypothetical protein